MEVLELTLPFKSPFPVLALGAEMKRGFSVLTGSRAYLRIGKGPLNDLEALTLHKEEIDDFLEEKGITPEVVAVDAHPLYLNRKIAGDYGRKVTEVQHHRAHIASVMAENGITDKVIGISLDGTGYGDDGAIWGGEFFVGDLSSMERMGHIDYFPLQGGDKAATETWRPALGILNKKAPDLAEKIAERVGEKALLVLNAIRKDIGTVLTSSAGRLFDAAAFLILGISENTFEAEAPIKLEKAAEENIHYYKFSIIEKDGKFLLDPFPVFREILEDKRSPGEKSFSFHYGLAIGLVEVAEKMREATGIKKVAISGGVFQNRLLTSILKDVLLNKNFEIIYHTKTPPHDGSLALGQGVLALQR